MSLCFFNDLPERGVRSFQQDIRAGEFITNGPPLPPRRLSCLSLSICLSPPRRNVGYPGIVTHSMPIRAGWAIVFYLDAGPGVQASDVLALAVLPHWAAPGITADGNTAPAAITRVSSAAGFIDAESVRRQTCLHLLFASVCRRRWTKTAAVRLRGEVSLPLCSDFVCLFFPLDGEERPRPNPP